MPTETGKFNPEYRRSCLKNHLWMGLLLFGCFLGIACTTRVSEWVLLNIVPVNYSLRYVYEGPIPERLKIRHEQLREEITGANIRFTEVSQKGTEKPFYGLYYKNRLFARYNNPDELKSLTTSPLRKKMAGELMDGKLCVMVYLRSGDIQKDEKGLQMVRNTIGASPFRDIIGIYDISRSSGEEVHFVNLLLNVESDLADIREPMLFGIFGRFKALEPLVGGGITDENIRLMIDYLKAECSCLIKDDLPGTDMLYSGNWENPVPARLNRIIDENPSLGK